MFLDIVIKGEPAWANLLATIVVGFGAASIGLTSIFLAELWRQVLAFRAAAKYLRTEIAFNYIETRTLLKQQAFFGQGSPFRTQAWEHSLSALAPVLSDDDFNFMATNYELMATMTDYLEILGDLTPVQEFETLGKQLTPLEPRLRDSFVRLHAHQLLPRTRILRVVLLDRPASISPATLELSRLGFEGIMSHLD